jgi:hypothetical protein
MHMYSYIYICIYIQPPDSGLYPLEFSLDAVRPLVVPPATATTTSSSSASSSSNSSSSSGGGGGGAIDVGLHIV